MSKHPDFRHLGHLKYFGVESRPKQNSCNQLRQIILYPFKLFQIAINNAAIICIILDNVGGFNHQHYHHYHQKYHHYHQKYSICLLQTSPGLLHEQPSSPLLFLWSSSLWYFEKTLLQLPWRHTCDFGDSACCLSPDDSISIPNFIFGCNKRRCRFFSVTLENHKLVLRKTEFEKIYFFLKRGCNK